MKGKIKELNNLNDFKKVYKVFSGPPYNEKYRERINGKAETMQNIFLEIDLEKLNKDNLKQGIEMLNYSKDNEIGG